ncbi:MAG: histidine phosphatase family protein [Desulfofustis sp.]|nr:histidine phosphatase family protein [Desulfofustis sp.]
MQIYLIRHGRTTAPDAYNGSTDIALSPEGMVQVRRSASLLKPIAFDACYCSPLQRCRHTLELLDLAIAPLISEELREIDFGVWEGLTLAQIAERDQENLDRWQRERGRFSFPGGEGIETFSGRVAGWFDSLAARGQQRVLVVTHAGVIRRALCHLLGLGHDHVYTFGIKEAGVTLINHRPDFCVLEFLNRGGDGDG